MKGKTIIVLLLSVGLLSVGAAAYGLGNDHGFQGSHGGGYGHFHGPCYRAEAKAVSDIKDVPCPMYRHRTDWKSDNASHDQRTGWMGRGPCGMKATRGI